MLELLRSVASQKMSAKGLRTSNTDLDLMEVDIVAQMKEHGQSDIEMSNAASIIEDIIYKDL